MNKFSFLPFSYSLCLQICLAMSIPFQFPEKNKIKNPQNEFCKGWWKLIKVQGCKSLLTDNNIDQINLIINKITTEYRKYFCCSGALIILSLSKKIQGKLVWKSRTNTSYIFRNKQWSNIIGQLITVLCLLFLSFFFLLNLNYSGTNIEKENLSEHLGYQNAS